MNDFKWLAIAALVLSVVCFFITADDRRSARHWWRRRTNGRDAPKSKIILAFLPLFLLLLAGGMWLLSLRHGT